MNISIISLGCNKNLVDSEVMAGYLKRDGFTVVTDPAQAEVIVVNTCGFIEEAKVEAVDTIFEMAAYKRKKCRALLVSGCLSQRYPQAILNMPEVDGVLGTYAYATIGEAVRKALAGERFIHVQGDAHYLDEAPREISTPYYAYLKIADGCDNKCAYCAIPGIRGPYVSRTMESLLGEAADLKRRGVKELILTAQDTTRYGTDRGSNRFAELLEKIALLGFDWVRILYAYPSTLTDEVLDVMERYGNICRYVDIPLQHTEDRVLEGMNRHYCKADVEHILKRVRSRSDEWAVRTTLMCGFPGETEKEHKAMLRFIEKYPFDHLGVFAFSREEGTPAEAAPHQCHRKTAQRRCDEVMLRQGELAHAFNKRREGHTYQTLVEGYDEDQQMWYGRTFFLAPEVDGRVFFTGENVRRGEFAQVYIDEVFGYDYFGHSISETPSAV